jgi:uncharacterized RDD family membrane protein YckC
MASLWFTLGAALALAYSWLFAAVCGRTPGMAVAHLRVVRVRGGGALTPLQALARAVFAIPSAALGLFGFVLAFTSGQALHDRLVRTRVIADA